MFLDEAEITVHGGKGGDGLVSWRREKFVARGGPWGGDGGDGGDVIFRADANTDTLTAFAERKVFRAGDGENGRKARMAGRGGEDLILHVPPGTLITAIKTAAVIADLAKDGDEFVIAKGGRGGYGNAHFASSVRQAPDFAEKGEPGEEKRLRLELKLVADVGIIGYPSTGKSTLISVISAAKPKIGGYPFTTLVPHLGVVSIDDRSFIVCDVPGLIEGASEGKGLGDTFLRHIERCGILVHLLDVSRDDIVADYNAIRTELERYSPTLSEKRELVVLNKIDLIGNDAAIFVEELKKNGIEVFASISAATRHNVDDFVKRSLVGVLEERKKQLDEAVGAPHRGAPGEQKKQTIPVLRPHLDSERTDAFMIEENPKGIFTVQGRRIEQIALMTDWRNPGAVRRFRNIAERSGLRAALERAGAAEGSVVMIGDTDVSDDWL